MANVVEKSIRTAVTTAEVFTEEGKKWEKLMRFRRFFILFPIDVRVVFYRVPSCHMNLLTFIWQKDITHARSSASGLAT